jgi:trigger factor
METKIEKLKGKYKIKLTLTKDEWEACVQKAYEATAGKYKVQGFRPGKAPRGVIEKTYGDTVFVEDAMNKLLSREYSRILVENPAIKPIDRPEINVSDDFSVIDIAVDVEPEFTLGKYTGLQVKRVVSEVTEGEVEKLLGDQARMRSRQVAADKGYKLAKGDVAVINFVGSVDGVEFEGGKGEKFELEIGSNQFIDTFEEQLVGKTIGERVNVNVKFPDKYHAANLAGKKALFVVDITNILRREVPVIDDTFAKEASEFGNLADWKKDIRVKLQENAKAKADSEVKNELLKIIIESAKIDIPEKMIEMKLAEIMQDMEQQLAQQGATVEIYAQHMNIPMEELMKSQRVNAERAVRARLVLDTIVEKEKITVTDEDVKAKIEEISAIYNKDAGKIFKKDAVQLEMLREDVRFEKLIKWLMENNKIV